MYHHIGQAPATANGVHRGLTVSAEDFETQVKWLFENGYKSVHLLDILSMTEGKFIMPRKAVIFTFDDGYQDVFQNAIPILQKYGFTGSFGIISQWAGTVSGDNVYASWDQIKTAASQNMEIVCHTQNHFDGSNPKFNADYIFQNLSGCQQDIKNYLGSAEPVLIYPYGHYNAQYREQARKVGFTMGVTVHEGNIINIDNLMEIPRVRLHSHEDFELFKKLITE